MYLALKHQHFPISTAKDKKTANTYLRFKLLTRAKPDMQSIGDRVAPNDCVQLVFG